MPDPAHAARRRLSLAAIALVVVVFSAVVAGIALRVRGALREQVRRREGEAIYSVALLQLASPSARLTDFGAADPIDDLFNAVLESSRLRGVLAVRLFDGKGAQRAALPATAPEALDAGVLAQMERHEPIVQFFPSADLAAVYGLPPR